MDGEENAIVEENAAPAKSLPMSALVVDRESVENNVTPPLRVPTLCVKSAWSIQSTVRPTTRLSKFDILKVDY